MPARSPDASDLRRLVRVMVASAVSVPAAVIVRRGGEVPLKGVRYNRFIAAGKTSRNA